MLVVFCYYSRMERNFNKLTKVPYKPFPSVDDYDLYVDNQGDVCFLKHDALTTERSYLLEIDGRSMVPRDGLLMTKLLSDIVFGKRVLDLGTGGGVLAIHSAVFGASIIVATDIDINALESARNNGSINNINNIEWLSSDLFLELKNRKFDLILSNPPQLPMPSGLVQDSGGSNGRMLVEKIISEAPAYLDTSGMLLMVLFDFLGIDESYSDTPPLRELFRANGFDLEIVTREKSPVRKGGQTEKNTDHILRQYPKYKFEVCDGKIIHEKLLIKAQLAHRF